MNVYLGELYKEVEYIQSSGTQYINTGVLPSNTKGIYAKLSSQDVSNDLVYLGAKPTSSTRCWVGNVHSTYNNRNGVYYGWESLLKEPVNRPTANTNSINEIGLNYLNSRNATFNGNIIHSNLASLTGGNYPIYIFCGNNEGTASYHSKIKLYSLKISDGSNLVRDFIPCYRVSDNVIGLFDKVENKFYTNAGTGTFTKGNDVKVFQPELKNAYIGEYKGRLPSGYQEVQYIQSSGTQRINTGINVSNDITYGFECKMGFAQISTGTGCIMDMGNTSTDNNRYGISYYYSTSSSAGQWQFGATNPSSPYWGYFVDGYGPTPGTDYTLSYNINGDKVGKINGTSVLTGMSISNISYANNWNIFCQTYGSTYTRYGTFKLYYMKIYHGSTLVRNFIPCYRTSDTVIGLYDLVNNQFYTNAGTGTFTKGPDVN